MFKKFDHVSIAVRDIDEGYGIYRDALGGKVVRGKTRGYDGSFSWAEIELGGIKVELIQPEDKSSFVHRFLDQKGSKVHHLTFEVDNIDSAVKHLQTKGFDIIGSTDLDPEWKIAFLSPKTTGGVLIQIFESKQ
jgi:methylmalonyl-CoA/ethylmalonyl-CoA epimerase